MAYKVFRIPVSSQAAWAEEELNAFLRARHVSTVQQRFVDAGENSYWCFCVEYVEQRASESPTNPCVSAVPTGLDAGHRQSGTRCAGAAWVAARPNYVVRGWPRRPRMRSSASEV
jgi:hypothetical protein